MPNEFASIPEPQKTIDSLFEAVSALKQTVESLIGQRGTDASTAVTKQQLSDQANLAGVTPAVALANLGLPITGSAAFFQVANNLSEGAAATKRTNLGVAYGKQSVWVPAAAMVARTTNGAAPGTLELATNKNMVKTLDFDATTQEFAQFDVRMPKSWDEGTVTFIPVWSHAATATNFGVVWGLDAVAVSDDDTLDVAFGTEQTSTDTGGTTNDSYQGPESAAVTVSGTPQVGDLVMFRIHRDPANGSDTMAIDARLHGVLVLFTNDATNDT
jgi:hypothetical protein